MESPAQPMIPKIIDWDGSDISGPGTITIKLDGVRGIWDGTKWLSRAGKPLYNIPEVDTVGHYEIYSCSHKNTIVATRTQFPDTSTPKIVRRHLYQLWPELDNRLYICQFDGILTAESIIEYREATIDAGDEGLVIRTSDVWYKVKALYTLDVIITDAIIGKGKHAGRLGAIMTDYGKVGTGFSDKERIELWVMHQQGELVGKLIEVACMEFTPDDKFRHPRFIRLREDK